MRRAWALATVFATAGALACGDTDLTGPLGGGDLPAALRMGAELPSLPDLASAGGQGERLGAPIELWQESWSERGAEGSGQRAEAYATALGPLAEALGEVGVAEALVRLERALATADRVPQDALSETVVRGLAGARGDVSAARRALAAGALTESLLVTLLAADRLREVGPEGIARTLLERGEGRLSDTTAVAGADPEALGRAARLLSGARAALDEGNVRLALQRAYYACQLLDVDVW